MAVCLGRASLTACIRSLAGSMANASSRPSSDMAAFRHTLADAKHVVVLTGAGISAESGVPTFRGAGGLWRTYESTSLASPTAFRKDPSLVWEFYHYRRELVLTKQPNAAHYAIAECEKRMRQSGRQLVTITQNVDDLHLQAGTENVLRLHGSLFRVRCVDCGQETDNRQSPICEALRGKGAPDVKSAANIPHEALPRCDSCSGLLRPAVVWFGEQLDPDVLQAAHDHMEQCDVVLVVGTSSVVYPAAMFAPMAAARQVPVAEFNMEHTPHTQEFGYHFTGSAADTVPRALAP